MATMHCKVHTWKLWEEEKTSCWGVGGDFFIITPPNGEINKKLNMKIIQNILKSSSPILSLITSWKRRLLVKEFLTRPPSENQSKAICRIAM